MLITEQKYRATAIRAYGGGASSDQTVFEVLTLKEFPAFVEEHSNDAAAVIMAFEKVKLTEPVLQNFWHYEDLDGGDWDDPTGLEIMLEHLGVYKVRERERLNEELAALEAL